MEISAHLADSSVYSARDTFADDAGSDSDQTKALAASS